MPNEFKVKNGLFVDQGGATITGSVIATGGFTGSLQGTASWATNALTASFISTASTNAFVQGGNSFGATALLGTNDNQSLAFETSGSTRMLIDSSGSIGIGTLTPTSGSLIIVGAYAASTSAPLVVRNTTAYGGTANQYAQVWLNAAGSVMGYFRNDGRFYTTNDINSNYIIANQTGNAGTPIFRGPGVSGLFFPATNGLGITTNGVEALRVFSNQNVSIGTITDSGRLTVRGSGTTSATTALRVENTNASASLVVLDNGFVGINTGSAQYNLDVNGMARVISTLTSDTDIFRVTNGSAVNVLRVQADGDFIAGGSTDFGIGNGAGVFMRYTLRVGALSYADASAVLQADSTTKGFLPPRTATTASIASPAQGLITYITGSANEGLHYYNSGSQTGWHKVLTNTGSQSITGSLIATSFTGSLQGTASWATNALTASYVNPLIQNVIITGSLIASGTYGGINTVSNKPNLFDINGITRVQWSDGVLNSSANDTTVDWENKVLYDSTTNTALDWENRGLYDTAGSPSIDWTGRILSETTNTFKALDYSNDSYLDSQLYYRNIIPGQVQQALSDSPLYAGQVIQATVDAGVTDYDLVSLDTDGTWKSVKAAVGYGADKMLGICVDQAGGYVLIEGDVGVSSDDSQGAYVAGANYGLPIYASTTTGEMTTTAPSGASSIVRVVGHIYYQSATDTNWWTMKFRPSNDWYVI